MAQQKTKEIIEEEFQRRVKMTQEKTQEEIKQELLNSLKERNKEIEERKQETIKTKDLFNFMQGLNIPVLFYNQLNLNVVKK